MGTPEIRRVAQGLSGTDPEFAVGKGETLCACGRSTYVRSKAGKVIRRCTGCDRPVQDCRCKHPNDLRQFRRPAKKVLAVEGD